MKLIWVKGKPSEIRAGMLLRVKGREGAFLVGDVNELLGACDCCREFKADTVVAYAQLLNPRDLEPHAPPGDDASESGT